MSKEIVKKELIKSIKNWIVNLFKIEEYEKTSGLNEDQLFSDDKYLGLLEERDKLRKEAYRQIMNSKYYILTGGNDTEKLLFELIEQVKCFKDKSYEKALEDFLDTEFLIAEETVRERLKKIWLILVSKTTKRCIDNFYKQAINCYVYGNYDACCIMCRAIIERVLKETCKEKLKGRNGFEKYTLYELIEFCRKFNITKAHALELAENIRKQGKDSIHSETLADEKNAIASIRKTQAFLRDIL